MGLADKDLDIVISEVVTGGAKIVSCVLAINPKVDGKERTLKGMLFGVVAYRFNPECLVEDVNWKSSVYLESSPSWKNFLARPFWSRIWIL